MLLFFAGLIFGVIGLCKEPSYSLAITVFFGAAALLTIWWPRVNKEYAGKRIKDKITFDYSNNNGKYSIGQNGLLFETKWTNASDTSIHIYTDPPSIDTLAIVNNIAEISDITGVSTFDFSSRRRTPKENDIIILKNKYGNYAALKIISIKDSSVSGNVDEVVFKYVINPDGKTDFR